MPVPAVQRSRRRDPASGRLRACVIAAGIGVALFAPSACTSAPTAPTGATGQTTTPSVTAGTMTASVTAETTTTSTNEQTTTPPSLTAETMTVSVTVEPTTTGATEHSSTVGTVGTVTAVDTIATGLDTPWGLGFLPDGTALITERGTAQLRSIGTSAGHPIRTVGTVSGVQPGGEGGLLGLAVDPDYSTTHRVFVYFTSSTDNRVAALTLADGATTIVAQHVILTGIPKASVHNGGRLAIGPDGLLYIGTGDATQSDRAQDLDYLGGKILRVTLTGAGAPGNPFPAAPLVYSYGHRNVQGLAFDADGRLWASEFGQNAYDELNLIKPGANYGWPVVEGPSDDPRFTPPVKYWPTSDASPSGLAIVDGSAWMAALRGERLWQIPLDGPAAATPKAWFDGTYGRLRTVMAAPDGTMWLITNNTDGRGTPRAGDDRIIALRLG